MKADPVEREYVAITAEAACVASAMLALLPDHLCAAAPAAAVALLLRALPPRIPRAGRDCAVFVPDPLAPDFRPLLSAIADALEAVQADGRERCAILTPLTCREGGFSSYSLSLEPASGTLVAVCGGRSASRKCAAKVRVRAPLPIEVRRHPVKIFLRPDARTGGACIAAGGARSLVSLATGGPPGAGYIAYLLYLCPVFAVYALRGRAAGGALALFAAAAAPIMAVRLLDFKERIALFSRRNALFARLLARRFLPGGRAKRDPSKRTAPHEAR